MIRLMRVLFRLSLAFLALIVVALVVFRINAWWQETEAADALRPENGRFVETAEGRMHVSLWGEEGSIPVVMTHGMAAWGGLWEETAEHLAANGYRVIAVDQPPFGFSDRKDKDFSRSRQAVRIGALARAMKLDRYLLVGHSYGGGVALETALRFGDRIAALVLVSAVVGLDADGAEGGKVANPVPPPLRWQPLAEMLISATVTNPLLTGFLTKLFMHQKEWLTGRHVDILQRPMALAGNTENMVLWLRQFLAGDDNALSRKREEVRSLRMPVALIWGNRDTVTPIEQAETLVRLFAGPASFVSLDDVGHMPQLEASRAFNTRLLNQLNALRSVAAKSD